MRLPAWDELDDDQLHVAEHSLVEPLFAAGPPGSGKTVLAVQRAQAVASIPCKVLMITYNRMLRRAMSLLDESRHAGTTTMHSEFGRDYWRRVRANPPAYSHDSYEFIWSEVFANVERSGDTGHVYDHLIIDEGQDLPAEFFEYARRYMAPVLSVFADENQELSGRGTTLEQIKRAAGLPKPIILATNHRNTREIVEVANHFHDGRLPVPLVTRSDQGERPRLLRTRGVNTTCEIVARWSRNRGGSIGVVADQNKTVRCVHAELTKLLPDARVDFYASKTDQEDSIHLFAPGITVLNAKSAKGQEFDTLFLLELERFLPCRTPSETRTMYMLCSRPRTHLFLVYGPGDLSQQALAALPNESLLERP